MRERNCSNCKWCVTVYKHPWNKSDIGKGAATELMGYVCMTPDIQPYPTFIESNALRCECHEFAREDVRLRLLSTEA